MRLHHGHGLEESPLNSPESYAMILVHSIQFCDPVTKITYKLNTTMIIILFCKFVYNFVRTISSNTICKHSGSRDVGRQIGTDMHNKKKPSSVVCNQKGTVTMF